MRSMSDVNDLFVSGVETAAQMSIGQAVLRLVDRIMWVIEKSIQWSLPTKDASAADDTVKENGKSFGPVELVRPLPWILFLPSLIILRLFRFGINTTASVFGYPEIQPSDMIRVIQRGRRRIRAIKSSGLKSMRQKRISSAKDRTMTIKEASKSLAKSIRLTLSTLSCLDSGSKTSPSPPPTKIRVSNILDTASDQNATEEKVKSDTAERKRNYSEISTEVVSDEDSDMESLIDKINRLANESGSDDKDFHKLLKNLEKSNSLEPLTKMTAEDSALAIGTALIAKQYGATLNGVGNDVDPAYFSPISWKSISPDLSMSPDKKDGQLEEENGDDLSNGEVENGKEEKFDDSIKPSIEAIGEVVNDHMKEKQKLTSQSGGSNKHHHKNKRGSHGNRKKK